MSVQRLFTLLFAVSLFSMAARETLDADMWWHLRTGEYIVNHGIPREDVFSYTVPDNEWITHEWLSEVVMWAAYDFLGFPSLILVFALITTAAYFLVFLRSDGRPYLAAFVVLLAAMASAPFWGVRPQVFNMLFAALFVFIVEGFKDGTVKRRTLWLLPVLTVFWANAHSGYLVGIALLVCYLVGETLQLRFGVKDSRGLEWPDIRWLGLMTILSFLAAALNPNGPELWIYPFFTLGSQAMQQYILEWQSPDFHLKLFWPFAALLVVGLLALIFSKRRPSWTDLLLYCGLAGAGLLSARHIPLFAIVCSPVIARYLMASLEVTRFYPLLSGQQTTNLSAFLKAINWLLLIVALAAAGGWALTKIEKNEEAVAANFPAAAVDFLESSGLDSHRGFNSYNWGGYLIWRGIPVFVDGRADVYGDEFLHRYRKTYDLDSKWKDILEEYDVDYILMESAHSLSTLVDESDEWQLVYSDQLASVFSRDE